MQYSCHLAFMLASMLCVPHVSPHMGRFAKQSYSPARMLSGPSLTTIEDAKSLGSPGQMRASYSAGVSASAQPANDARQARDFVAVRTSMRLWRDAAGPHISRVADTGSSSSWRLRLRSPRGVPDDLWGTPVYAQVTGSPHLLLDESGPAVDQVAALESVLFLRDPFSVRRVSQLLSLGPDPNTRLTVFVANLQPGQASVVVNLSDNNNLTYDITPEDVRLVPGADFVQITFRLPDGLAPGTCRVKVTANNEATNTGTFRITLGAEQWRQDLQYLATQLPILHKNAFFKTPRTQFDQVVADLDRDIPALQDHEVVVRMMRIVAMIGDAHTTLRTEGSALQFRSYPLKLYWFSDGLYATAAAAQYRQVLGARLARIGATDVLQAYAAVGDLIPHENEPWLKALSPAQLVSPEALQALRVLPDLRAGSFVFRDAAGQDFGVNVDSVSADDNVNLVAVPAPAQVPTPLYRRHPELNYWFDYLEDSHTLYLQYNVCQNMPELPFSQFAQQLQGFAATHQVDRFVIDLRNNTGGDSSILQPLVNALAGDANINRRERLFVIIGRLTFSSGLLNAISLRQMTNATFVGEATGGKPNAFGEVRSFRLVRVITSAGSCLIVACL